MKMSKMPNLNPNFDALFAMMIASLRTISNYEDCHYSLDENNRETPCACPPCTASQTLYAMDNWRFIGSRSERQEFNPREAKVMRAWSKTMDDKKLSLILDEDGKQPTPRDWYVASSIIQWLTTNVGMCILEEAGYKYQDGDSDYKWQQERTEANLAGKKFNKCGLCHHEDKYSCGHWVGKL